MLIKPIMDLGFMISSESFWLWSSVLLEEWRGEASGIMFPLPSNIQDISQKILDSKIS